MTSTTVNQSWFETIFELAPDAYYLVDQAGTFMAGNKAVERLLGYTRDELVGIDILSLEAEPPSEPCEERTFPTYDESGETSRFEQLKFNRKDGSQVDVEIRTRSVTFDGQDVVLCIAREISHRNATVPAPLQHVKAPSRRETKEREHAQPLHREQFYHEAIAAAGAVVYHYDFKRHAYVYIDPQIENLLGYSHSQFTPAIWKTIILKKEIRGELARFPYTEALQRHRAGEFPQWHADYECTTSSGDTVWLADSSVLLRDEQGQASGSLGILQNITVHKRAALEREIHSRQQAAVLKMGKRALERIPIPELLHEAIVAAANGLDVEMAQVMELTDDRKRIRFTTSIGWDNDALKNYTIPIGPTSQAGLTILTNEPVVVGHLPTDSRFNVTKPLQEHRVVSGVTVVIRGQSEPFGVLGVHSRLRRQFSTSDINFLQSIANTLGEAIERRKAVDALVESEQRLQLVTDAVPAFISYVCSDRRYRVVSKYYELMFRIPRRKLIGKAVSAVLGPDVYQSIKPRIDLALEGQPQHYESDISLPGLGRRILDTKHLPDISPEGVVRGFYTFAFDVTERKDSEVTLRQSEHRLRMVTENIPAFVAYVDADERYQFVNSRNAELKGRAIADIIGRRVNEIVPAERYRDLQYYIQRVFAGEEVEFEVTAEFYEHGVRTIYASLIPDFDGNGNVRGYYSFATDTTDRRQAEIQARERLDQLAHVMRLATAGEMATGLAHELNQPLTASATYADICLGMLQRQPDDLTQLEPILASLKQQVLRAGEIIRRMRSYVRKERFHPLPCRLVQILNEVVQMLKPQLSSNEVHVEIAVADQLPQVYVDHVQIEQVLLNLLQNAIDSIAAEVNSAAECRRIEIEAIGRDDGFVEVTVSNSGSPIEADDASKVFDAFYSTKPDGMGMGLAICRTIIEAHGGSIRLIPDTERGTTFRLTLPMAVDTPLTATDAKAR